MASSKNEESDIKPSLESAAEKENLRVVEPSLWQMFVRFWRSGSTEKAAESEAHAPRIDKKSQE